MPRTDRHNEIELNLLTTGRLLYRLGGRRIEVEAGRLTAFWACTPHQVLGFESLNEYFVMTIPITWFLQWRLPEPLAHAMLHGHVVVEHNEGLAKGDPARFDLWTEDLSSLSAERARSCALEVEARLRRMSLGLPGREAGTQATAAVPDEELSCAERIAAFIALHYTEALTVERIARHVGLHPNYAMTLFRQAFGTTVSETVHQHRLSHAQRLLVTTQDTVERVALASGFGSTSRFHQRFRQSFGCSPRAYRARLKADGTEAGE